MGSGQGTPWGAARYGQPTAPTNATYQSDPSKYAAYNYSPQANQAMSDIGANTAGTQARQLSRASQMGAGRSAGVNRQLADTQAQSDVTKANVQNQMAQQSFAQQLAQMANQNQWNLGEQGLQNQQYLTNAQLAENERQNRRQAVSQAFGPLGGLGEMFGGY